MNQDYIQKKVEERAEDRLQKEYEEFYNFINKSAFCGGVKVDGDKHIIKQYSNDTFLYCEHMGAIADAGIKERIEKRRAQLIKEEGDRIFKQLESVSYLFDRS